ncbi:MAG: 2-C-methyl-D-erythritol 2,4-cyclodiphosphate synthase [Corallococcus sp.]|nr:2-C-methyl-D-erythritol 2,4-cyclodiphosphate synthase [Corallococcus sp.]
MKGAIILAAGSGTRFGGDKLAEKILGKTVLQYSVEAFQSLVDQIVIVTDNPMWRKVFPEAQFADGGETRGQSVVNGLAQLSENCTLVAIHDGARPFVSRGLIERLFDCAQKHGSAVPRLALTDTAYIVAENSSLQSVERNCTFTVQTPQIFDKKQIAEAYRNVRGEYTDDSAVYYEQYRKLNFEEGERGNIKLTYQGDLPCYRTGAGYDIHALADGGKLLLGGVTVDFDRHLAGHSDADVVVHAIMDALLSASGNKDIGVQFPDTDSRYLGADSLCLLSEVVQMLYCGGYETVNVSASIAAQRPKLAPYLDAMSCRIASVLNIPPSCVNLTATTTEGLGIVGEGKGIACHATALLKKCR